MERKTCQYLLKAENTPQQVHNYFLNDAWDSLIPAQTTQDCLFISLRYYISLHEGHFECNGQKNQMEKSEKAPTHAVVNIIKFQIGYRIALECFVS